MASEGETEGVPGHGGRSQFVFADLLGRIRSGALRSGTRIRENDVARMLGVSRTPVREAIARLEARGLVEAGPQGMVVAALSRSRVIELYAVRTVLEAAAARFAAENAGAGDLVVLTHMAARFDETGDDAAAVAEANAAFHGAIHGAAHNEYLMQMLSDLNDSLALLPGTTFAVSGRTAEARLEHRRIIEAIAARDGEAAEAAAREHMRRARDARLALLVALEPTAAFGKSGG